MLSTPPAREPAGEPAGGPSEGPAGSTGGARRDAIANRRRILERAETYFAERGTHASLRGLARAAGVGEATLYRHFPNHAALIRGMYDELVDEIDAVVSEAARASSPWLGVVGFLRGSVETVKAHPAAQVVMREQGRNDPGYRPGRRWEPTLRAIVAAAVDDGSLRPDVRGTDLAQIPLVLAGLAAHPEPARSLMMARHLGLYLDGLSARPGATPLGEPVDVETFHRFAHRSTSSPQERPKWPCPTR